MSQWGAWAAARDGRSYEWILSLYYPGAVLGQLENPDREVKVKISSEPWKSVSVITQNYTQVDLHAAATDMVLVKRAGSTETTERIGSGEFLNATPNDGKVFVFTERGGHQGPFDWVEARPVSQDGRVGIQLRTSSEGSALAKREYWGSMRVEPSSTAGRLNVYNQVPMEKYLRSIGEVEYDWAQPGAARYALEAVKAQTVAARTYVAEKLSRTTFIHDNGYDLAYLGYLTRGTASAPPYVFEERFAGVPLAAEETAGEVLRHNGALIESFFSAHSGGYTTAWYTSKYPYLPATFDPYSLEAPPSAPGPGFPWTFTISQSAFSGRVNGMPDVNGSRVDVGAVQRVEVASRDTADPESHVANLRLIGDKGTAVVRAHSMIGVGKPFSYNEMRSTLILSITNPRPDLPPGEFTDVGHGHMYYEEIKQIALEGLMGGYDSGEFRPEASVSRWQFAKIAVGLHNLIFPDDPIPLLDVADAPFWDVWARPGVLGDESDWVAAAKKAGLVRGVTETSFGPYNAVQRDQLATMLVRAMGFEDEAAALPPQTPGFADVSAAGPHASAATYLRHLGVLQGMESPVGSGIYVLNAAEPTKRMHVAVIISRLLGLQDGL
jgi:peptidoglycan hydrolase-like amidase